MDAERIRQIKAVTDPLRRRCGVDVQALVMREDIDILAEAIYALEDDQILIDWFGRNEYRELELGEPIHDGDVFIQDGKVHPATDVGNGFYTSHHFNHYRIVI